MKNPFEEQAKYHKNEAEKWSVYSKIAFILLIISIFIFGMC